MLLLITHALISATRGAIDGIRISRLAQLSEEGNSAADIIERLARNNSLLYSTGRLSLNLILYVIICLSVLLFTQPLSAFLGWNNLPLIVLVVVGITMGVSLIFTEILPREFGRQHAEHVALRFAYPYFGIVLLTLPIHQIISRTGKLFYWRDSEDEDPYGPDVMTGDDLRTIVDGDEDQIALGDDEKEMIRSIFTLEDTSAREIMIPRIDMITVEANTSVMDAVNIILDEGHSRLPMFHESVDNITGVIYAKDLMAHWRDGGQTRAVLGLERQVYYVPETKPVSDLLKELREQRLTIAIVLDEYGGVAGLVTVEDILEEIVGEIEDEYDQEEFYMEQISDHEYIFSARVDLDDVNDEISANLPTDEADTLGGLVYNLAGNVPQVGDSITFDDLLMTVLRLDGRRITTVKIQRSADDIIIDDEAAYELQAPQSHSSKLMKTRVAGSGTS